jgi:hypothetical protein
MSTPHLSDYTGAATPRPQGVTLPYTAEKAISGPPDGGVNP